jgi:hypothetical protein
MPAILLVWSARNMEILYRGLPYIIPTETSIAHGHCDHVFVQSGWNEDIL